ncbi:hypothetical protein [Streptomyces sp. NBC_00576]|uniref:hypothetical protein n=1 Tax=Streptomyces sp. NBC_00576 TaxID=2903665 RepID=UPI002E817B57|nr:hypothetical protein [Streptomyces sp. NBC_00576]WUB72340.1 hypothetical protein OG734_20710 [Streptomyces sp. NBC_00576]
MSDLIGRLITWVGLLATPHGTHRRTHPTTPLTPTSPPPARTPLPTHRSPYSLDAGTRIDGTTTRSVRPYLTAHEQRLRHRELATATLGIDVPGPYWIHGTEVA